MDLSRFETMDSNILLGIVNEKLRLECDSLDDLAGYFDIPKEGLEQKLEHIGFQYDFISNQFKQF
ncbi:DUF4250 domain-containing protein [Motilimonas pumila]|uniref:DUF4250 domain-containing protein n=1 Tax=Motilimonas pumila TaxID=2303987 RepID=A0A418YF88_9GAMM|nr:DUF4250 domain-containing protein [Motilimonas pumila]RJG47937.1 DUF4250 domain-containing protein [Motilimonas pumila]